MHVISCYTEDYQQYADNLEASLRAFPADRTQYSLDRYSPKSNWLHNCAYKAEFIAQRAHELLKEGETEVCFLDADCTAIQNPSLFFQQHSSAEFGAVWETNLTTSVLFFRLAPRVLDLLDRWAELCKADPNLADHKVLEKVFKEATDKPSTVFLKKSVWCCPADVRDGNQPPIIEHLMASRHNRESMNHMTFSTNLENMKGALRGAHIIVSGCGPSAQVFTPYVPHYFTVGVNDIGRYWHPDILLVVDSRKSFELQGRWHYVMATKAGLVVYNQDLPLRGMGHPAMSPVELTYPPRERGKVHIDKIRSLPCWRTSTLAAAVLAYQLGASKIGLIGADYTDEHPSTSALKAIDSYFSQVKEMFAEKGCELVQLSPVSKMKSLPLGTLADFSTKEEWSQELVKQIAKETEKFHMGV